MPQKGPKALIGNADWRLWFGMGNVPFTLYEYAVNRRACKYARVLRRLIVHVGSAPGDPQLGKAYRLPLLPRSHTAGTKDGHPDFQPLFTFSTQTRVRIPSRFLPRLSIMTTNHNHLGYQARLNFVQGLLRKEFNVDVSSEQIGPARCWSSTASTANSTTHSGRCRSQSNSIRARFSIPI